jgi:enterochelin esterase-like enzyme
MTASRLWTIVLLPVTLQAQQTQRPAITSPEILTDGRVVFRLFAPKASEVQLSGDWMGAKPPEMLSKDESGVWSVTAGPFEPNIYTYGFVIDGVRTSDPSCRCTLAWAGRAASSKFVIKDSGPRPWDEREGPRGTLHYETYYSDLQRRPQRFLVYTPADYRQSNSQTFPVLVLLPGTPGDESDWTSGGGFADVIFDNLIAEKKMRPMVVVMHAADILRNGRRADNLKEFEPMIVKEIVPEIQRRYRVARGPELWAIAGLSLGGEFAMTVGLRHPELFRSVASLSGSMVERDFEDRFGSALAKPADIASRYRLIWIGCGSGDIFFEGNKSLAARLTSAGIKIDFLKFEGPHVMPVFRRQLVELLPRLFR